VDSVDSAAGDPAAPAEPAERAPAQAQGPAQAQAPAQRAGAGVGAWHAFRTWRRSRPFWGGLLLAAAGLEMLAIPLLSVLAHASVKVVIYIGIGGVFGVLIGGLLVACGMAIWFHPAQRVFYAIAGVLLAVVSFIATNLGGFFVGMLLGVTGGSLSFGWAPGAGPKRPGQRRRLRHQGQPPDGLDAVLGNRAGGAPGNHRGSGGRLKAFALLPLIISGLVLPGYVSVPARPAARAGCIIPIPIICPSPSPTTQPPAAPSPVPTAIPTVAGAPGPAPSGSAHPTGSGLTGSGLTGSPSASASPAPRTAAAPAQQAAAAQSSLSADSALLEGLAYDGTAQVPTASGTVTMMKFTMRSLTLSGNIAVTVSQGGGTAVTRSSTMHFGGPVVLYATKLSGDLLGLPVTITPGSPLATILKVLAPLTQAVPVPMTNVVTDQPYTIAGSLQADGLQIGA
jgi:hypothetical protein